MIENWFASIESLRNTDVRNTSTLSLEKTALLDKLHKLEESNLKKVDKFIKLEEKYKILQETFKITEKLFVKKEIQHKSLTDKVLFINALTVSNDHPKTSMSTKEREVKPSKRKTKKLKFSEKNANKTNDSDENQALAKEENDLLRQICEDPLGSHFENENNFESKKNQ
ncbi:hypothetical protein TNCV_390191 [Trichonephila clavipes]|nr:hypothetical protein TNCV_390191 [Trichonephila clavipes]